MKKSHLQARSRYQLRRRNKTWKRRKKIALRQRLLEQPSLMPGANDGPDVINKVAPSKFSFVENTDELLKYLYKCRGLLRRSKHVRLNIGDVEELTPDGISLLVAHVADKRFIGSGTVHGNAPKDKTLQKLFVKSGFYNYVDALKSEEPDNSVNFLHNEKDFQVRPLIAKRLCLQGIRHTTGKSKPFEPLYEIIVEAMQNTNNHANPKEEGDTKWWVYVYNDRHSGVSKYCFLDLGVGIFESMRVTNLLTRFAKDYKILPNSHFVKNLLDGTIQSRKDKDHKIRGKGIPQIVDNAKLEEFKEFIIITNDVKIDVKKSETVELRYNFSGTFLYWELQSKGNESQG